MKHVQEAIMSVLGLLMCAVIGLTTDSCAHRSDPTPEKQAEYDSTTAEMAQEPQEWADPNAFVKAYKAWAENDSIQQVIYSMPETTLCAVCNVVKRNHSKFTAKDVVTEYLAHKEIYDESAKAQPKIRSDDETSDTLSYDTIIGDHKVHVTEYTKIEQ